MANGPLKVGVPAPGDVVLMSIPIPSSPLVLGLATTMSGLPSPFTSPTSKSSSRYVRAGAPELKLVGPETKGVEDPVLVVLIRTETALVGE
jgi:hypothetical protein